MSIKYPSRMKQLIDFEGMCSDDDFGRIMPMDIDGLIEFKDNGYMFYEVKYKDAETPLGQRIALERLVKDTSLGGKKCVAIIVEHSIGDTDENVILSNCMVREIYTSTNREWVMPSKVMTAGEYTDLIICYLK